MSTPTPTAEPRALYSKDGQSWAHDTGDGPVVKIVIGTPPRKDEKAKPVALSKAVRITLERHLPTVTHLHLWQVTGLGTLPTLRPGCGASTSAAVRT